MTELLHFLTETTTMGALWCVAAVLILMLELGVPGSFFFVSFAAGAAIAAPVAWFGFGLVAQCLTCMAVSIVTLALCWRFVRKQTKQAFYRSNIDALIDQHGTVTQLLAAGQLGRIKVRNEEWQAICTDPSKTLHVGTQVRIVSTRGNTLFVFPSTIEGKS